MGQDLETLKSFIRTYIDVMIPIVVVFVSFEFAFRTELRKRNKMRIILGRDRIKGDSISWAVYIWFTLAAVIYYLLWDSKVIYYIALILTALSLYGVFSEWKQDYDDYTEFLRTGVIKKQVTPSNEEANEVEQENEEVEPSNEEVSEPEAEPSVLEPEE